MIFSQAFTCSVLRIYHKLLKYLNTITNTLININCNFAAYYFIPNFAIYKQQKNISIDHKSRDVHPKNLDLWIIGPSEHKINSTQKKVRLDIS